MQISRFLEMLTGKSRSTRIPVLPVQIDAIRPLLERVAAAEAAERAQVRARLKPDHDILARALALVSLADGGHHPRMQTVPVRSKSTRR